MDRIDIFLDIPRVNYEKLTEESQTELSGAVRKRVQEARQLQLERFMDKRLNCNGEMTAVDVKQFCKMDAPAETLMKSAMKQIQFTARAFHRTLKLARTVADMDKSDLIRTNHLAEALQYRQKNINL